VAKDGYFLKYDPPAPYSKFSTLSITFTKTIKEAQAKRIAHREAFDWIDRYPVPTAVYCTDLNDDNFRIFEGDFACYFWKDTNGATKKSHKIDDSKDVFENFQVNHELFSDISFKTRAQVEEDSDRKLNERISSSKRIRFSLAIIDFVFPVVILIFSTFMSPMWYTIAIFLISLVAPVRRLRQIYQKPSREKDKDHERQQKIKEYTYHCDRNPDGFLKLKLENWQEDARISVQKENAEINSRKKE